MIKKHIHSVLPLYCAAAVWLVMGLILPIYKLWAMLVTLALSVTAAILLKKVFPGRDIEIQKQADSGDAEVDRQIEAARAVLKRIHDSNEAIHDEAMSQRIARMERAGADILAVLERDTSKASMVRRFLNYYLPTADKLLSKYRELVMISGGSNVESAISSIDDSMEMIAVAFEKQLDALFKDQALDIETDIEVLETMIQADGHAEKKVTLKL